VPGPQFNNGTWDAPGRQGTTLARNKVELFLEVVCTKGSAAGSIIKTLSWGVDADGYFSGRSILYSKIWWPAGPYPKSF
jgi:hypothetical protein